MRSWIVAAFGLLIVLGDVASSQDVSASKSPVAQSQPPSQPKLRHAQKNKPARIHASAKPGPSGSSIGTPAQGQNRAQTNTGNRKGGKANANINASPNANTSYAAALQRCVRERHDRNWWRQRYTVIVLVGRGYYYWDSGYWYPAFGYDPVYEYYDYDGPIFTYGNLLPDQVIINVQRALKELGYYGAD
ncbi:MAG: hypothetical protein M3R29_00650 [Verrucomicrobiota bacterium]|nr:hypothetical protein [Verrucomicrobiota bacterium]